MEPVGLVVLVKLMMAWVLLKQTIQEEMITLEKEIYKSNRRSMTTGKRRQNATSPENNGLAKTHIDLAKSTKNFAFKSQKSKPIFQFSQLIDIARKQNLIKS